MGGPVGGLAPLRRDSRVRGLGSRGNQRSDLDPVVLGRGQGGLQNAVRGGARGNIPDNTALKRRASVKSAVQRFVSRERAGAPRLTCSSFL